MFNYIHIYVNSYGVFFPPGAQLCAQLDSRNCCVCLGARENNQNAFYELFKVFRGSGVQGPADP